MTKYFIALHTIIEAEGEQEANEKVSEMLTLLCQYGAYCRFDADVEEYE